MSKVWDYVIIGGGTAGCVLAARLSEDPKVSVLLLEAGGKGRDPRFAVPGGQLLVRNWRNFAWQYPVQPDASRLGIRDNWRRGKSLGGSSMINGLIYARGLPNDYDEWAENGAPGWSYRDVLPAFKKLENYRGENSDARGDAGPLSIEKFASPHPLSYDLISAFHALGASVVEDINALDGYEGMSVVGETQTNQRNGIRQTSARAYLGSERRRKNLTIFTGVIVDKVCFDKKKAVGVIANIKGRRHRFDAAREVHVSAGPIASPCILMRSGIGPAEQLQKHGIEVIADRSEVGRNLQEHPELYLEYVINQPSYISGSRPLGMVRSGLEYILTRGGPATSPGTHLLSYMKSSPETSHPDLLFFAGPWGALEDTFQSGRREEIFSLSPSVARPKSRGFIKLSSANPFEKPIIEANLLSELEDVRLLMNGVRLGHQIAHHPHFSKHIVRDALDVDMSDNEALEAFVREKASICYHACGTCRMGEDHTDVVDTKLRVKGVRRLRVVDASVMPSIPSGNTMAPVFMIAERAAEFIRADRVTSLDRGSLGRASVRLRKP